MRIISSINPESYGEKIRLRNLIFGKIGRLGIPLIWFTLNPHDIGNIFIARLAGEEVALDDPGVKSRWLKLTLKEPKSGCSVLPYCYYRLLRLLLQMSFWRGRYLWYYLLLLWSSRV